MHPELERVVSVVQDVARTLPDGCASLTLHGDLENEVIVGLQPRDGGAAPVVVHAEAGLAIIDVGLGLGGFFEVPRAGRRYSDLDQLDEVRALLLAAVEGRYRETVWLLDEEAVRSNGVVTIGTTDVPVVWAQFRLNPFRRPVRREFDYAPYEPDAAAA